MNYETIRDQIKSGDILAWTHKGIKSFYDFQVQAVRAFTRSEYSHVGIAWVTSGRVLVLEAVVPQIRIFPLSKLKPFYWMPSPTYYWNNQIEEFALDKVGEEYSKWQAIQAFFNKVRNGEDQKWECAEYVNTVLKQSHIFVDDVQGVPSITVENLQKINWPLYLVD